MKKLLFILLLSIPFIGFGQGWEKTFGDIETDKGRCVQQTTDGGYIITGTRGFDILLLKTDGNGIVQWSKTFGVTPVFGDSINCRGYSVQQTSDGGYIISGGSNTWVNSNGSSPQSWLIKTDGNGIEQWNQHFGFPGVSYQRMDGKSVQQTSDGGYIITGYGNGLGGWGLYLLKTDGNGIEQWNQIFPGSLSNGYHVEQTSDGGYIICGETIEFGNGERDVYLIKTDGSGNITSTFNIPTPSSNRKLEKVVDILGRETKPQQNTPFIEIYDDGSTEKKIVVE
jgi:hypothetical protein